MKEITDALDLGIKLKPDDQTTRFIEPTIEELEAWSEEGICEATDGCRVEPDGTCEHGHKSWLLHLGMI